MLLATSCFFHAWRPNEGGFTRVHACPWTPGEGAVDLAKSHVLEVTYVGETPFAYGQLGDEVLTCSNMGGLYAFNGQEWRVLRKPVRG